MRKMLRAEASKLATRWSHNTWPQCIYVSDRRVNAAAAHLYTPLTEWCKT